MTNVTAASESSMGWGAQHGLAWTPPLPLGPATQTTSGTPTPLARRISRHEHAVAHHTPGCSGYSGYPGRQPQTQPGHNLRGILGGNSPLATCPLMMRFWKHTKSRTKYVDCHTSRACRPAGLSCFLQPFTSCRQQGTLTRCPGWPGEGTNCRTMPH